MLEDLLKTIGVHRFTGMTVIVLPDDDERLKDIPDDCVGTDGGKIFVRASMWPRIKDQLISMTSNAGVSGERSESAGRKC
jgi:hypothetical protein